MAAPDPGTPPTGGSSGARPGPRIEGHGGAPRETSGLTTRLIVEYVRGRGGDEAVAELLEAAGDDRPVSVLLDEAAWSTYDQKIALFAAAADLLGDADVAYRIGASVLQTQVGATTKLVLLALGSPQMVLRSVAKANVKFSTTGTMRALDSGPGRAVVTYRLSDGYEPSRHDCLYTQGVLSQASALFGMPPARIDHPHCQVLGADECRYEVRWSARLRFAGRRKARELALQMETAALREQLSDLQVTGAEIVVSSDLDALLARIADRASSAVQAQRYLLAIHLEREETPRVHAAGFSPEEAEATAAALLAPRALSRPGCLVSEVVSTSGWFGRLAAYLPEGEDFLPDEQAMLDAYASLAAAALANATAIAEANRRREVSDALVDLARTLARAERSAEAAQSVADAVPAVVGSDRSLVMLWDEDAKAMLPAGTRGFPAELDETVRTYRVAPEDSEEVRSMFADPRPALHTVGDDPLTTAQLRSFGHVAAASAPIMVRGRAHGTVFACWTSAVPAGQALDEALRNLSSLAHQAGLSITSLRMLEAVRHQATHDTLTGLANRTLFHDQLATALHQAARSGDAVAVCFLDLDGFKSVNDNLGHAAGDEVLTAAAERIRSSVRAGDVVARLSGDEFGVLLAGNPTPAHVLGIADKLVDAINRPFRVGGREIAIGVSIGIALAPDHGLDPEDLLNHADTAMYDAKRTGSAHRMYSHAS